MPSLAFDDAILKVNVTRNVVVAHWYDAPTLVQLNALEHINRRTAKSFGPDKTIAVNVAHSGTPNFTGDVRTHVTRSMKDTTLATLGAAHIVLLSGFAGIATRAFLSGTMLIAKPPGPAKVFSDLESAAKWLEPLLKKSGEVWTISQIMDAFEPPLSAPRRDSL